MTDLALMAVGSRFPQKVEVFSLSAGGPKGLGFNS